MLIVVFLQIVGKDISVHECPAALAEDVEALLEELDLDPGHVVLLHLAHLVLNHRVQLVLKLEGPTVVHVPGKYGTCKGRATIIVQITYLPAVVKDISLESFPALFLVFTIGLGLVLVISAKRIIMLLHRI